MHKRDAILVSGLAPRFAGYAGEIGDHQPTASDTMQNGKAPLEADEIEAAFEGSQAALRAAEIAQQRALRLLERAAEVQQRATRRQRSVDRVVQASFDRDLL